MKEYQIGNTKMVIHSDIVNLSEEERKQWFKSEMKKGNPVLKEIEAAVNACYEQ